MEEWGARLGWLLKGGAVGLAAFWGGLIPLVQLLLILMAIDIFTGVLSAAQRHEVSSQVSFAGMTKKGIALLLVATAAAVGAHVPGGLALHINLGELDLNLSLDAAVAGFYCANEGISILENAVEAKLPVPQFLKDALAKLSPEDPAPPTATEGRS